MFREAEETAEGQVLSRSRGKSLNKLCEGMNNID